MVVDNLSLPVGNSHWYKVYCEKLDAKTKTALLNGIDITAPLSTMAKPMIANFIRLISTNDSYTTELDIIHNTEHESMHSPMRTFLLSKLNIQG